MKKMMVLLVVMIMSVVSSFAQSQDKKETSYDQFISQSGKIISFLDYKLPPIRGAYSTYECKIRVLKAGDKTTYYYQVAVKGKYSDVVGSIEENDLNEMAKALDSLLIMYIQDKKTPADYMENKYVTNDGVELGYYISGSDSSWYLGLSKYKSDSTAFIKDGEIIKIAIKMAQDKIKTLKQ